MITHRNCGGVFEIWTIREHHYCFMRCNKCQAYLGSDTEATIKRLMRIKVRPTIRRA